MKVIKATKLSGNPRKRTKRKLSPKQIAHFGTKRQKAALKASRKRKRNSTKVVKANAHRKRRAQRSPNPLVLHLKPIQRSNPKRSNKVAKANKRKKRTMKNTRRRAVRVTHRRRASNPRRHRRRRSNTAVARRAPNRRRTRRRNSTTRVVVMAPRRSNGRRRSSRNPNLFGSSLGSKTTLKILGGGLVGVAATKFIPTLSFLSGLTSSVAGSLSTFGPFVITGISALAAWWLASRVDAQFAEGVLFGGLMQTVSVALNAFLPGLKIGGIPLALAGLSDLVPGRFAVPQNPLRGANPMYALGAPQGQMAPAGAKVTTSGLGRAYPSAY